MKKSFILKLIFLLVFVINIHSSRGADFWMDVDTALSEVPVNIVPLIDDTDFKTIKDAIAYNAAGMDLTWNFVTTGGAFSSTAVIPTTLGIHDWAEHIADDGLYTIEIPASAGTISNDTEGFGWFTGVATGVLPWRGPIIGFRDSGHNDALVDSAWSATKAEIADAVGAFEYMTGYSLEEYLVMSHSNEYLQVDITDNEDGTHTAAFRNVADDANIISITFNTSTGARTTNATLNPENE